MSVNNVINQSSVSRLTVVTVVLAALIISGMIASRYLFPKAETPSEPAFLNLEALADGYTATVRFGDEDSTQSGTLVVGKNGIAISEAANRQILHQDNDVYVKVSGNDAWYKVTLPPTDAIYDAAYFDPNAPMLKSYEAEEEVSCGQTLCIVYKSSEFDGEFLVTKDNKPFSYQEPSNDTVVVVTFGPKADDPTIPDATLFKLPDKPTPEQLALLEAIYAKFPEEE